MKYFSKQPLDMVAFLSQGSHSTVGARVFFSGEIRGFNHGKEIRELEYEAHVALAEKMIEAILNESKAKWKLHYAHCLHRIGKVSISESAVLVLTASAHRAEAYAANQEIIRRVKHQVPIWKKEVYADGTHIWAANCDHLETAHE